MILRLQDELRTGQDPDIDYGIDWGAGIGTGVVTLGAGLLGAAVIAGVVAALPVEVPAVAIAGIGAAILGVAFASSYYHRYQEAQDAHMAFDWRTPFWLGLVAGGDVPGINKMSESWYNSSVLTGASLNMTPQQRSASFYSGAGELATFALAPAAAREGTAIGEAATAVPSASSSAAPQGFDLWKLRASILLESKLSNGKLPGISGEVLGDKPLSDVALWNKGVTYGVHRHDADLGRKINLGREFEQVYNIKTSQWELYSGREKAVLLPSRKYSYLTKPTHNHPTPGVWYASGPDFISGRGMFVNQGASEGFLGRIVTGNQNMEGLRTVTDPSHLWIGKYWLLPEYDSTQIITPSGYLPSDIIFLRMVNQNPGNGWYTEVGFTVINRQGKNIGINIPDLVTGDPYFYGLEDYMLQKRDYNYGSPPGPSKF